MVSKNNKNNFDPKITPDGKLRQPPPPPGITAGQFLYNALKNITPPETNPPKRKPAPPPPEPKDKVNGEHRLKKPPQDRNKGKQTNNNETQNLDIPPAHKPHRKAHLLRGSKQNQDQHRHQKKLSQL